MKTKQVYERALEALLHEEYMRGKDDGLLVAHKIRGWLTRAPDRKWQKQVRDWADEAIAYAEKRKRDEIVRDADDLKPPLDTSIVAGLIEWIVKNGGTVRKFNDFVLLGKVNGIRWRYFLEDGDTCSEYAAPYACVETNGSFAKVIACHTLDEFVRQLSIAMKRERKHNA